ncbi:hypothetical protein ROE7235_00842 [Roseibaca ekhonensis]|jgi:hypothetical protein|uniref:Uncharacterized protein n=1 Tax=Roseinatronobacter ekhonensis TaxID=254356 RepID=A0A3B0MJ26_9RHOB|nr:hypothetical protein [Roseibaca ekhonensis]SUZ31107.1 hypothetical protein ROE7235_00842 [Roseibaca ekhonensis]
MKYSGPIKAILERELKRLEGRNMDAPTRVVGEIGRLHSAVQSLEAIALNRNPADNDALHMKKTHEAGQRLAKSAKAIRSQANEILSIQGARLGEKLLQRTGLRPPENLEAIMRQSELRAVVRSMDSKSRHEILQEAVKAQDADTLSALFNAPAIVTGFDRKLLGEMRRAYESQVAPEIVQELDAMIEADHALQVVVRNAETAATQSQDAQAMVAFVKAEEAAKAAQENFSESMQ